MDEITRRHFIIRVRQDAFQVSLAGGFDFRADFPVRRFPAVRTVRSTTDTVGVGTRSDMPVSLPFTSGIANPTALAAPVVDGMMLMAAARPPFQSLREGPSARIRLFQCVS